jgi:phage terminase Nu1 subunit (DNA packaging protein)
MQILHKVAVIARFLNLTERRVQQLARDGIIPKAEKGKYDLVRCVQQYVRYLQDRAYGNADAPRDTHHERARLIKAQADKTELEVAALRNQLIPIETIEHDWMQQVSACRMRLLAIPSKSAFQIAALKQPTEIERFLKAAIYEALSELAHDEPLPEADAESAPSVDAAAGVDRKPVGGRKPKTKPGSKRRTRKVAD